MLTIGSVLLSWFLEIPRFLRDASLFYYRLFQNKWGLPKWLWLLMLASWLFGALVCIATGK